MENQETTTNTLFDDMRSRAEEQNKDLLFLAMEELAAEADVVDFLRGYTQGKEKELAFQVISSMRYVVVMNQPQTNKLQWQSAIDKLLKEM